MYLSLYNVKNIYNIYKEFFKGKKNKDQHTCAIGLRNNSTIFLNLAVKSITSFFLRSSTLGVKLCH